MGERPVLVAILAGGLLIWAAGAWGAPLLAEKILGDRLATMPGYEASVDDVDLSLLGGWGAVDNLVLRRPGGEPSEPFVAIERLTARPRTGAWLRGDRIADVEIDGLVVHYVIGPTEAQSQTEIDADWVRAQIGRFPITVDQLVLRDSALHYHDVAASPDVHLSIDGLEGRGTNLANLDRRPEDLFGTIDLTGRVMEEGKLAATVQLDPYAETPTFDLQARVTGVPLTSLKDALRAYARFDAEAGTFSVVTELQGRDGRFWGVATPEVKDLKVTRLEEMLEEMLEEKKPLPRVAWEAVVGLAGQVAELVTPGEEEIQVDVPIRGEFGEEPPVLNVLRVLPNAWFGALTRAISVTTEAGAEAARAAVEAGQAAERERGDKPRRDRKARKDARKDAKEDSKRRDDAERLVP